MLLAAWKQLHEFNPMLGHRGCRLGITYPEITEMQARAIFEAAVAVAKEGIKVLPGSDDPADRDGERDGEPGGDRQARGERSVQRKRKARATTWWHDDRVAARRLVADEIAKEAEFFSFGTNDLTQTTCGFSRDDVNKILPTYLAEGILKQDPFAVHRSEGVGAIGRMAIERGRKTRPNLEVGICGEHGGEPSSVEFCHQTWE